MRQLSEPQSTPSRLSSRLTPVPTFSESTPRGPRAPPTPFPRAPTPGPDAEEEEEEEVDVDTTINAGMEQQNEPEEVDQSVEVPRRSPTPVSHAQWSDVFEQRHISDESFFGAAPRSDEQHPGDFMDQGDDYMDQGEYHAYDREETASPPPAVRYTQSPSPGPIPRHSSATPSVALGHVSSPRVKLESVAEIYHEEQEFEDAGDADVTASFAGWDDSQQEIQHDSEGEEEQSEDEDHATIADIRINRSPAPPPRSEQHLEVNHSSSGDEEGLSEDENHAAIADNRLNRSTAPPPGSEQHFEVDHHSSEGEEEQIEDEDHASVTDDRLHRSSAPPIGWEQHLEDDESTNDDHGEPQSLEEEKAIGEPVSSDETPSQLFPDATVLRLFVSHIIKVEQEDDPADALAAEEAEVDQSMMAMDSSPARAHERGESGQQTPTRQISQFSTGAQASPVANFSPMRSSPYSGTQQETPSRQSSQASTEVLASPVMKFSPMRPYPYRGNHRDTPNRQPSSPVCTSIQTSSLTFSQAGIHPTTPARQSGEHISSPSHYHAMKSPIAAPTDQLDDITVDRVLTPEPDHEEEDETKFHENLLGESQNLMYLAGNISEQREMSPSRSPIRTTPRRPRLSKEVLESDPKAKSVVEISSMDPRAAARAAALLKMNYDYIEYGIDNKQGSQPLNQRRRSSRYFGSVTDTSAITLPELLHEAELELLDGRSSRMTSPALTEMTQATVQLPGFYPATPQRPQINFEIWSVADWRELDRCYRRIQRRADAKGKMREGETCKISPDEVISHFLRRKQLGEEELFGQWQKHILELRVEALERKFQNRNVQKPSNQAEPSAVDKLREPNLKLPAAHPATPSSSNSNKTREVSDPRSLLRSVLQGISGTTSTAADATPKATSRFATSIPASLFQPNLRGVDHTERSYQHITTPGPQTTSQVPPPVSYLSRSLIGQPILKRASVFPERSVVLPLPDYASSTSNVDQPIMKRASVFPGANPGTQGSETIQIPSSRPISIMTGQVSRPEGSQHAAAIAALFKDDLASMRSIRPRQSEGASSATSSQDSSRRRSNPILIPRRSFYDSRETHPTVKDIARSFEASIEIERSFVEQEQESLRRRKSMNFDHSGSQ